MKIVGISNEFTKTTFYSVKGSSATELQSRKAEMYKFKSMKTALAAIIINLYCDQLCNRQAEYDANFVTEKTYKGFDILHGSSSKTCSSHIFEEFSWKG